MQEQRLEQAAGFWSLVSGLYRKREDILESSHRLIELSETIDTFNSGPDVEQDGFDVSTLQPTFSAVQRELNLILSRAYDLRPHLAKDGLRRVHLLASMAQTVLVTMGLSTTVVRLKLRDMSMTIKLFAQEANKLSLNPTKRSLRVAFGVDVTVASATLKAYLEQAESNY